MGDFVKKVGETVGFEVEDISVGDKVGTIDVTAKVGDKVPEEIPRAIVWSSAADKTSTITIVSNFTLSGMSLLSKSPVPS